MRGASAAAALRSESRPRTRAWRSALPRMLGDAELSVRVNGACMLPLLRADARVRVRRERAYWPGDVLAFVDAAGEIKLHRCIGYVMRAGRFCVLTQPDASAALDAPTPLAFVIGRVSGGECDARAVHIPWPARVRALRSFFAHARRALERRLT